MGKRKLHNQIYFQCDWTGLPMRFTNAWMPTWKDDKLTKHGSYSCWECVVAHAWEMHKEGITSSTELSRVRGYVDNLVGCEVQLAPHWTQLQWFSPTKEPNVNEITSGEDFMCIVEKSSRKETTAVLLTSDGKSSEVLIKCDDQVSKFTAHLTRPLLPQTNKTPSSFVMQRKKLFKDKDLTIVYWPEKNGLPLNQIATNLFKVQIYGDVLLAQQTKEACFMFRERFVPYSLENYAEQFNTKKRSMKETSTVHGITMHLEMQEELNAVEVQASSNASAPSELAMASVCPAPSGQELAALARLRTPEQAKRPKKAKLVS